MLNAVSATWAIYFKRHIVLVIFALTFMQKEKIGEYFCPVNFLFVCNTFQTQTDFV